MRTYARQTRERMGGINQERARIERSVELSAEGKKVALARLMAAGRTDALISLKAGLSLARRQTRELNEQYRQAEQEHALSWDTQRLAYFADVVRGRVRSARQRQNPITLDALELVRKEFKQALAGGDRALALAWTEAGLAAISESFANDAGAGELMREMDKARGELLTSAEMVRIAGQQHEAADTAVELVETVKAARSFYDGHNAYRSEFDALLEGVRVTSRGNPDDFEHFVTTTVEFADAEPGGE